ncbi:MAG TPA: ribonuclease III [Bacteroidales bacterium]|nr:ribonuclease III [Bacteroidales bacterium]HPO65111.1 ribonuclease III [Bacteroidales bacterium]
MITLIFRLFYPKRKAYQKLVEILGYIPRRWHLYETAFVYRSASLTGKGGTTINNERLEFLGDAILDAIVADYLFKHYPSMDEGFLSKMRSKIVKRNQLNALAFELGLDQLIISTSFQVNGGKYVCGNALEALIGAMYLDRGYEKTHAFVIHRILNRFINLNELEKIETDYKSRIIEWAQKQHNSINFDCREVQPSTDPTHPLFIAEVYIDGQIAGSGEGFSKKEAEQRAAEMAYDHLIRHII